MLLPWKYQLTFKQLVGGLSSAGKIAVGNCKAKKSLDSCQQEQQEEQQEQGPPRVHLPARFLTQSTRSSISAN